MIADKIREVEAEIAAACQRVGRDPNEVTLIAVSKTKPIEMLEEAYEAGARYFGENKVQEINEKYDQLPADVHWQMIGHLQRNKVKQVVGKAELIHSVDSLRLAEEIDKESAKKGLITDILLEVNVAKEESKFGFMPEEVLDFVHAASRFSNIRIKGLMTIAPFVADSEENRIHFANLQKLFVDIANEKVNNVNMSVLSMGMSNDYIVAVEEGATMVRVGTKIFGERNYA